MSIQMTMQLAFPQGINMNYCFYQWQIPRKSEWLDNWNLFNTQNGTCLLYREDNTQFSFSQYQQSRTRYNTNQSLAQCPDPKSVKRVTVEYDGEFSQLIHTSSNSLLRENMCLGQYTILMPQIPYLFQFIKVGDCKDDLLHDIAAGTTLCVG